MFLKISAIFFLQKEKISRPFPNASIATHRDQLQYTCYRLLVNRKYFHFPRYIFEHKFALGFDGEMVVYPVCR